MTERRRAAILFAAIAALAAAFRFPQLAARPMHADEAIHADKLGTLLEQGRYEYSATDFHGPSLYYVAMVAMRAVGIKRYVDLNEVALRAVPAVIGVLLVAAHFWLIPYLGLAAAACAALFTAVSPAMVYYSRYFIHETLLVFLTFCAMLAMLAYERQPGAVRAVLVGALCGLMFATKETWIIAAACLAIAIVRRASARHLAYAVLAFAAVGALLFRGYLLDSVLAYRTYLARGAGVNTVHVHPWYFYLQCLRAEAAIGVLAILGLLASNAPRFLKIYTVLMTAAYCAIPYKAPWNALSFWHATILLAGVGAVWLAQRVPKLLVVALVPLVAAQLGWQARADAFQYASDPRNPWVYAHTGTDVFLIVKQVDALAAVDPAGRAMPIEVFTGENLWPLPWYLRRYPNVRWWNGVADSTPLAPVILATPDMEPALLHRIYEVPPPGQREMYVNLFDRYVELRPRVEVRGYAAKSLWDELR